MAALLAPPTYLSLARHASRPATDALQSAQPAPAAKAGLLPLLPLPELALEDTLTSCFPSPPPALHGAGIVAQHNAQPGSPLEQLSAHLADPWKNHFINNGVSLPFLTDK